MGRKKRTEGGDKKRWMKQGDKWIVKSARGSAGSWTTFFFFLTWRRRRVFLGALALGMATPRRVPWFRFVKVGNERDKEAPSKQTAGNWENCVTSNSPPLPFPTLHDGHQLDTDLCLQHGASRRIAGIHRIRAACLPFRCVHLCPSQFGWGGCWPRFSQAAFPFSGPPPWLLSIIGVHTCEVGAWRHR